MKRRIMAVCLLLLPLIGASTLATGQSTSFPPYTPGVDLNVYERALASKDKEYKDNVASIQTLINQIHSMIEDLSDIDEAQGDEAQKQLTDYCKKLSSTNYDWGDQRIYSQAMEGLGVIQSNVRKRMRYVKQQRQGNGTNRTQVQSQNNVSNSSSLVDEIKGKIKDKKYNEAIDLLTKLINETSDPSYAIEWRARVYMNGIRNYDKAAEDYTTYIHMNPKEGKAYYYRGVVYERQGKDVEAIKDFSSAIAFDPSDLSAYFSRGVCKSNLGDRSGAIADYDAIIARLQPDTDPKDFLVATVYNNKGYCLFELGKYAEALPLINKALELGPEESYIWASRGELYYKQGKYKEAIQDMTKAIQLDNDHATRAKGEEDGLEYYIRGMARIKTGDKAGGCADLSKAGELGSADAYKAIKEKCK